MGAGVRRNPAVRLRTGRLHAGDTPPAALDFACRGDGLTVSRVGRVKGMPVDTVRLTRVERRNRSAPEGIATSREYAEMVGVNAVLSATDVVEVVAGRNHGLPGCEPNSSMSDSTKPTVVRLDSDGSVPFGIETTRPRPTTIAVGFCQINHGRHERLVFLGHVRKDSSAMAPNQGSNKHRPVLSVAAVRAAFTAPPCAA